MSSPQIGRIMVKEKGEVAREKPSSGQMFNVNTVRHKESTTPRLALRGPLIQGAIQQGV